MEINYYGLMIALGAFLAFLYLILVWYQQKIPQMWSLLFWTLLVVPFAIFGARLWTYWFDPITQSWINAGPTTWSQWNRFFGLTNNKLALHGLSAHGGIFFGGIYLYLVFWFHSKRYQISLWFYFDSAVKALLILQIIGRWGNFFNKELLGNNPFTSNYPHEYGWIPAWFATKISSQFDPNVLYHPLFLYESFGLFLLLCLLCLLPQIHQLFYVPWQDNSFYAQKLKHFIEQNRLRKRFFPINYLRVFIYKKQLLKMYYTTLINENCPQVMQRKRFWWPWAVASPSSLKRWLPLRVQIKHQKIIRRHRFRFVLRQALRRDSSQVTNHFGPWWTHFRTGFFTSCYLILANSLRLGLQSMRQAHDQMNITEPLLITLIVLGILILIWIQWIAPYRMRSRIWRYEIFY